MPAYLSAFGGTADVSQPLRDIAIYEYASPQLGRDRSSANVRTPPAPAPKQKLRQASEELCRFTDLSGRVAEAPGRY